MVYYPSRIDTDATLPPIIDGQPASAQTLDKLRQAIIAVEKELGVKPSGTYATVRARLEALEGVVGNLQIISLAGDLGGTLGNPRVIGFQGRPISTTPPTPGQVLVWDGIAWSPSAGPSAEVTFGGDLTGNPAIQRVVGINQIPVEHGTNADIGKVLKLSGGFGFPNAIHFDGTYLWVKDVGGPTLYKVNPTGPSTAAAITLPSGADNMIGEGVGFNITSDAIHVYVGIAVNISGEKPGRVYVVEKSTGNVVGRINAAYASPGAFVFGIAVRGNDIFVASGFGQGFANSVDNQSQIDKYSKSQVLANPLGVPVLTLPASASNSYHGGMCFGLDEGNTKLFVTSYGVNGKIYKINPDTLVVEDSFSFGSNAQVNNCAFSNGYIWAPVSYSGGNALHKFNPASLNSGSVITVGAYGKYVTADSHNSVWVSSPDFTGLLRVDTSANSLIANVSYTRQYLATAFDGTFIWGCEFSAAGVINIDAFSTGLGTEAFDHAYSPINLRIVYGDAGGQTTFQVAGTTVVTSSTLNVVSGAEITTGLNGRADITVNALPPPGNAYDYVRLIPANIENPIGLYFDESARLLWVTNSGGPIITVIDVDALEVLRTIDISSSLAFSSWKITGDSTHVFVTTNDQGRLVIISKNSFGVVGVGDAGITPYTSYNKKSTAISLNTDNNNDILVVCKGGQGDPSGYGEVRRFSKSAVLAGYPTEVAPEDTVAIPDGVVDWEDMCFVGGEGAFLVTGSAGWIYQVSSVSDSYATLFDMAVSVNPPHFQGYQLGGIIYDGSNLYTTALGSGIVDRWFISSINFGPLNSLGIGGFIGDIVIDGTGNLWTNNGVDTFYVVTPGSPPTFVSSTTAPIKGHGDVPFTGMAADGFNNFIWVVDPLHSGVAAIDISTQKFSVLVKGANTTEWFKGDVVFDDPLVRSNLVSTKPDQSPINVGKVGQLNLSATSDPIGIPGTDGNYSVILSGKDNTTGGGDYNLILGGFSNSFTGSEGSYPSQSFIGGGSSNTIGNSGTWNVIVGGEGNNINGVAAGTIGGGKGNLVFSSYGTVSGGNGNQANGNASSVGGGNSNIASGDYSSINGGQFNQAQQSYGAVGGGRFNSAGNMGAVGGGSGNNAGAFFGDGPANTVGGGSNNQTHGSGFFADGYNIIGGGKNNQITGGTNAVSGGDTNRTNGNNNAIGGGASNTVIGFDPLNFIDIPVSDSTIAGGNSNTIKSSTAVISGGYANTINEDADRSVIVGGYVNGIGSRSRNSFISSGEGNTISDDSTYCNIIGGQSSNITGTGSTIINGLASSVSADYATLIGPSGNAYLPGSFVYSTGLAFSTNQLTCFVVAGQTVFTTPTILLGINNSELQLRIGHAYAIKATVIMNGVSTDFRSMFVYDILAHCTTSSVAVIDNINTTLSVPNGNTWSIAFTAVGDSIRATGTGSNSTAVIMAVKYDIVEVGLGG